MSEKPFPVPPPVRGLLHERRISNRAVAGAAACTPQFVSRVLLGEAKPPVALQELLCGLLGCTVEKLFHADQLGHSPAHPGDELLAASLSNGVNTP